MLKGETLSQNLRIQRAKLNISRAELSSRSGVNISTIEKLENGRQPEVNTTVRTIFNLADALNVKPQELVGWE
ncbi:helix-turn-helix domain-containing protein [Lancefieldella parvula]|uniref:helix-turn-helix domain-containing protein n=1 Tax=Lancefieldella parvula TaxID=1382 RepID=UPI002889F565|nr:helix-turn-helix transcriptional regulator [Lancefieldella parvula]